MSEAEGLSAMNQGLCKQKHDVIQFIKLVMLLLSVLGVGCSKTSDTSGPEPSFFKRLPKSNQNNVWYKETNSPTAIVFVHGILGDSRDTWLYSRNSQPVQYWPDLLANDPAFARVGVYLGG